MTNYTRASFADKTPVTVLGRPTHAATASNQDVSSRLQSVAVYNITPVRFR